MQNPPQVTVLIKFILFPM